MGVYGCHGDLWVSMNVYGFLGAYRFTEVLMGAYGCS